jgi:hypothetical protein
LFLFLKKLIKNIRVKIGIINFASETITSKNGEKNAKINTVKINPNIREIVVDKTPNKNWINFVNIASNKNPITNIMIIPIKNPSFSFRLFKFSN